MYKIIRLLLPMHEYAAQFERGSSSILSYFRQFRFVKVDNGCIYSRLEKFPKS